MSGSSVALAYETTLDQLLPGQQLAPEQGMVKVAGLQLDSRKVGRGDLFVALRGDTTDGHDYIDQAISRGAGAVLVELEQAAGRDDIDVPVIPVADLRMELGYIAARFYARPSSRLDVIGITGTNGKTSCCQFIAEAYSGARTVSGAKTVCGIIGTLGYGAFDQLNETNHTTPDAIAVQRMLAELAELGMQTVAMEVSSHALAQGRVRGVEFDTAVFTNLTRDHLDYHIDMENYGQSKRQLFFQPKLRHAVLNVDDEFGRKLALELPQGLTRYCYGLDNKAADINAGNIKLSGKGIRASISSPWGEGILHSTLLGRFNLSNLLVVFTVLCIHGATVAEALAVIATLKGVPGRMQCYGGGNLPLVVVDYAHTPDALQTALATLREICAGQLSCVFGCGGDRDRGKRPLMGQAAEQAADRVILTNDNPRREAPAAIVDEIIAGMNKPSLVEVEHDRSLAIRAAISQSAPGDVILVAGKGHENYQQTGAARVAFNDGEQVKQALQLWKTRQR